MIIIIRSCLNYYLFYKGSRHCRGGGCGSGDGNDRTQCSDGGGGSIK